MGVGAGEAASALLPVERCQVPARPVTVVSIESGQELGRWVAVEPAHRGEAGRCLVVVERPGQTYWVIDARRVKVRPVTSTSGRP